VKEMLRESMSRIRSQNIVDEQTRRIVHAMQSVMTPPARTRIDEFDHLIERVTEAYMEKARGANGNPQKYLEARRYRMIRRTLLDAQEGHGNMYTPKRMIELIREQLIAHARPQSAPSPNMKQPDVQTQGKPLTQSDKEITTALSLIEHITQHVESCPKLPEGNLLVDGKDGTLYIFQAQALRRIPFDTFRQIDDTRYTMFPAGFLDACQRRPTTSLIEQRTLTTVEAPDTVTPIFEPALFTISHIPSKMAFTVRGRQIVLEPHDTSKKEQQWRISGGGFIRSASDTEVYMTPGPDCDGIVSTRDPVTPWVIERRGNAVIELKNPCGSYVSVDPLEGQIDMVPSSGDMSMWTMTFTEATPGVTLKKNIKIF